MTWLNLVLLLGYIGLSVALYFLFPKAGREAKSALIPGYNMWVVAEIVGRKGWHSLLLLIPFFNVFIFAGLMVDLARSFGRYNFGEHVLAVIASWGYFGWLGKQAGPTFTYNGPILEVERRYHAELKAASGTKQEREINKVHAAYPQFQKPFYQDWAEAAVFAIFAAAFIRLLLIESYIIPTPSMEGNLNVGDFLFVSKIHYGLRLPQTLLMIPLAHNQTPVIGGESYIDGAELPYRRLPALEKIDRFDPVVFNVPAGDSVYLIPGRAVYPHDLNYDVRYDQIKRSVDAGKIDLITRPVDKRDHYVKRAIGLPGETIEVRNRDVYINGEKVEDPANVQYSYYVEPPVNQVSEKWREMSISPDDLAVDQDNGRQYLLLSLEQKAALESGNAPLTLTPRIKAGGVQYYPHDATYFGDQAVDNFAAVRIPERGMTIKLDARTYALYWRPIAVYEGNESFVRRGNKFFLDDQEITEYTFKLDYYWMMGDNRHNSEDSRVWGFVPETHVLGKPLFVWFSIKEGSLGNGVNWHRIGRSATKTGGR
ncbi:signal peptidase I [Neolewinella antarctica]|uniref:Signal peptidase I n=1 Tax=Neolewinella antarctica TaxID=442734 RepID=A0ABX0X5V8_9BACT|nr:signal peptidase I [Neolewinella antarctica]NJC24585.1 signal peptidase I [Neolewinella antarctica]